MSTEKIFVSGMLVKRGEQAPDYVLANLSIKTAELIDFLHQHERQGGWVNVVLKRAKSGKCYAELDTWKPPEKLADVGRDGPPRGGHWEERRPASAPAAADDDTDIPF